MRATKTINPFGTEDVLFNMVEVLAFSKDHPALTGTPPKEGNKICDIASGTLPEAENKYGRYTAILIMTQKILKPAN